MLLLIVARPDRSWQIMSPPDFMEIHAAPPDFMARPQLGQNLVVPMLMCGRSMALAGKKKIVADRTRACPVSGPGDVGRWSTENQKGPDCPTRAGLGLPPLSVPPDSGDPQAQCTG